jgi:hypothetical protein
LSFCLKKALHGRLADSGERVDALSEAAEHAFTMPQDACQDTILQIVIIQEVYYEKSNDFTMVAMDFDHCARD